MQSYTIITSSGAVAVTEQSGFILHASVPFLIGMDWLFVRQHAQNSGWRVVPAMDSPERPHRIVFKGIVYDFFWSGDHLADIIRNDDEHITWAQVPQEVRRML